MLTSIVQNFDTEMETIGHLAPSGFILAFNITFKGPEFFHSAYPAKWQEIYETRNYFALDPILVWAITNEGYKRWSEVKLPDVRGVLKEASSNFDMNYGAVFAIKTDRKKSFLTAARHDREFDDEELAFLYARLKKLTLAVMGDGVLTEAELDVLRCLRDGLTQKEIAQQLNVSESAIKKRSSNAFRKLNAKSAAQAVAVAMTQKVL